MNFLFFSIYDSLENCLVACEESKIKTNARCKQKWLFFADFLSTYMEELQSMWKKENALRKRFPRPFKLIEILLMNRLRASLWLSLWWHCFVLHYLLRTPRKLSGALAASWLDYKSNLGFRKIFIHLLSNCNSSSPLTTTHSINPIQSNC